MRVNKRISNHLLAFGFDWKTTESRDYAVEIGKECKKNGDKYTYSVHNNVQGLTLYTTSRDDVVKKVKPAAHIVLACLSKEYSDFVYFYKIDEEHTWICVVYEGIVVSDGDNIISSKSLKQDIQSVLDRLGIESFDEFNIITDLNAEPVLDELAISKDHLAELHKLVTDFQEIGEHSFVQLKSDKTTLIKSGVALSVAVGLYFYMSSPPVDDYVKPIPSPTKVNTSELIKKLPQLTDRDSADTISTSISKSDDVILKEAREQELIWLNQDLSLLNESAFLSNFHNEIFNKSLILAGWRLSKVTFDIQNPDVFEYWYSKTSVGTAKTLKDAVKGSPITLSPNGSKAIIISSSRKSESVGKKVDLVDLESDGFTTIDLMHYLDVAGLDWSMNNLSLDERPRTIEGLKNKKRENERQLHTDSREVIIKGKSLSELKATSDIFGMSDKLILERVVVDIGDKLSWSLYGVYHNKIINKV